MEKVKIEIEVSDKEFECANMILKAGVDALTKNQKTREEFGMGFMQIAMVESFRKKLIDSFVDNDPMIKEITK